MYMNAKYSLYHKNNVQLLNPQEFGNKTKYCISDEGWHGLSLQRHHTFLHHIFTCSCDAQFCFDGKFLWVFLV